ncbi:hypothetical protein AOLI_G00054480 [Acnodon oligacanthus]
MLPSRFLTHSRVYPARLGRSQGNFTLRVPMSTKLITANRFGKASRVTHRSQLPTGHVWPEHSLVGIIILSAGGGEKGSAVWDSNLELFPQMLSGSLQIPVQIKSFLCLQHGHSLHRETMPPFSPAGLETLQVKELEIPDPIPGLTRSSLVQLVTETCQKGKAYSEASSTLPCKA